MGKGPEQTLFQRRYMNGQQMHEKMLNIINYQGNANQNHSKIPGRMASIKETRYNKC